MTLLQSIFLGLVQGLTEFLPVSSSGHLAILQNIFHIDTQGSILFDILLHFGTLIVVFIVYSKDIYRLICEFFGMAGDVLFNLRQKIASGKEETAYKKIVCTNYRKFVILIIVSTIPTAIIGFVEKKLITDASSTLLVPGICLLITAGLLFFSDRADNCTKIPQDVTYREGIIIGIVQGFATLPGLSRSGATIAACLFCGLNRKFAVKYSFILSIPAILGATVLELKDAASLSITPSLAGIYLAGMAAAGIAGYVCIKSMLLIVSKRKFKYFAYYCCLIGVVSIVGHFFI